MANTLTPRDVYQLMNEIVAQATGRNDLTVVDTTTFTTVGETLLRTGTENLMNAISTVVGKTIFSVRPYQRKLSSLEVDSQRWGAQVRKVSYLTKDLEASQDYNTDLNPNQLADGNSIDMYKINGPEALQLNFYGTSLCQKHITRFRDQLAMAFRNEGEFLQFLNGVMISFNNEVELVNEGKSRATLLNFMAGISAMGLKQLDLVAEYNTTYSTTYSRGQLLSTYLESFMKFVASQVKIYASALTDMSALNHANIDNYKPILRHTPKNRQKMFMYEPIFITAQSTVYPTLFNTDYLNIGRFEGVNYWQSQKNPTQINVKPNILDTATGHSKDAETAVNLPYVLGLLYDEEALGIMPQFDYTSTTPFNSAGGYYNMYLHWRFNSYNDYTENAVLFTLGDGGAPSARIVRK